MVREAAAAIRNFFWNCDAAGMARDGHPFQVGSRQFQASRIRRARPKGNVGTTQTYERLCQAIAVEAWSAQTFLLAIRRYAAAYAQPMR